MTALPVVVQLDEHEPGTVIRVWSGLYEHVGLLGERTWYGERTVLSFSPDKGGFCEEPYSQFAKGSPVRTQGYLGVLDPWMVLSRARAMRGRRYSWTAFNCEHFVRLAHGVAVESPQLQGGVFVAGLIGMLAMAGRG